MKSITLAGLLCLPCALRLAAQAPAAQQPAAPAPAPQAPTGQPPVPPPPKPQPLQTNAPVDTTPEDDPDRLTYSVAPFYWLTKGSFNLKTGIKGGTTVDQNTGFLILTPGQSSLPTLGEANKHAPGGMLTFPAGKYNRIEITVFQAEGNGNSVAPQNLLFDNINIPSGDFIASSFRIRTAKVVWNYLTWPDPPETAKFRVRTMWGFQYTGVQTVLDTPFDFTVTSTPVFTHSIYYPSFGIGAEFVPSRHFYFEGAASGFGFPHRSVVWDAEIKAVIRFKHIEVFAGDQAYHIKTSPKGEEYIVGTLNGPYAGIRLFVR